MKEYSDILKKEYDADAVVFIVNTKQAGLYIKNGIELVDIFWSKNSLVFVFNRDDTKEVYDLWCKHELS